MATSREIVSSILMEIKEELDEFNRSCAELTAGQRGMLYDLDQRLDSLSEAIGIG